MKIRVTALLGSVLAAFAVAQDAPPSPGVEERLREQEARIRSLEEALQERRAAEEEAPAPDPEAAGDDAPPAADDAGGGTWDQEVELGLFFVRSRDRSHQLNLHARIMLDAKFDLAHDYFDDTFQVRRARFTIEGHVFDHVGFKLGLEFGRTSDADVRDAYIRLHPIEAVQLFAGQMILPFSTSRFTSSNYLKHPERPILVAQLSGSREIGFQLYGELADERVTYYLGIFNGNGQNVRIDDDDDKDLAARIEVRPLARLQLSAAYVFSPTNRAATGPADALTVGQEGSRFLDYDTGQNRRRGKRHRIDAGARLRWGPVEVKGEVLFDYQREVTPAAGRKRNLLTCSWFVDAAVVLTGEDSGDVVEPASPFYGPDGFGPGAFELALRYEDFQADPEVLRGGFATGSDRARSGTVTLIWIPVARLRWMLSYTGTAFDQPVLAPGGDSHRNDHVALLRMHFFF